MKVAACYHPRESLSLHRLPECGRHPAASTVTLRHRPARTASLARRVATDADLLRRENDAFSGDRRGRESVGDRERTDEASAPDRPLQRRNTVTAIPCDTSATT